ncbi:hypothetical protein EGJ86_00810 [Pseudomonas sp. o96-267]|uniref:hypothetical protein n=1 Tax=Pseudomonas sp. o96-267 TaxID=2479853 RepID=UPI000F7867F4|nr:hypothetical protein [Pseudomonas sp. o96-267]RRV43158.1 hypothetical protein EGJ86_00810 [Pseudomonas sp. o96-267]
MKKTLLALAVSTLATSAFAATVDHTATTVVINNIAREVVPVTAPTDLTTTDGIIWTQGFSTTNQNLVRIDLPAGVTFTGVPSLAVDDGTNSLASTISAGGVGQSFVLFQLDGTQTVDQAGDVTLTLAGLRVTSQADINVRYRLYDDQVEANNATTRTLQDRTFGYASFGSGLVFASVNPGVSRQIDVSATPSSTLFENGTDTSDAFGGLNLRVTNTATYGTNLSGPALTLTNLIGANPILTVSGDFSAISGTSANTLLGTLPGAVNTAETAVTYNLTATPAELNAAQLTYEVDGTTVIAPSSYNASLALGTGALMTAAPAAVTNFATLAKNGSTVYVDLALNPNGAFQNFVRISNKTNTAGNVNLTVIADDGAQEQIALGDIAGQATSELAARSSTTQISVSDIFAAAQAAGLSLSGQNKLRLVVDGEFRGGDETSALSNDYALSVQSITVSKDGNSFSTF